MFCNNCGKEIENAVVFCPSCGRKIIIPKDRKMEAEKMVQVCIDNNYMTFKDSNSKIMKSLNNYGINIWKGMFDSALKEIQGDETILMFFCEVHKFSGVLTHLGEHAYVLTNKRMLMVGARGGNPHNILSVYKGMVREVVTKVPYAKESLYLDNLVDVAPNMVKGRDTIHFITYNTNFNVMLYNKGISHQLCDEIRAALSLAKQKNEE